MLGALGALAAGTAYYFYGTAGTPKETAMELKSKAEGLGAAAEGKLGMRHSKADYQKVYDKIAEMMEKEDHDGELFLSRYAESWRGFSTSNRLPTSNMCTSLCVELTEQMDPSPPSSSDSLGTLLELTTLRTAVVVATTRPCGK
jgi:hypothetical protein